MSPGFVQCFGEHFSDIELPGTKSCGRIVQSNLLFLLDWATLKQEKLSCTAGSEGLYKISQISQFLTKTLKKKCNFQVPDFLGAFLDISLMKNCPARKVDEKLSRAIYYFSAPGNS